MNTEEFTLCSSLLCKRAQRGSSLGCDSIAKSIEPGARIQVLSPRGRLLEHGAVSMSHNEKPHAGVVGQQALGPLTLSCCSPRQLRFIHRVISEHWAQEVHHPKPKVGMQDPVRSCRDRVLNDAVDQLGLPSWLREAITMNRGDGAVPDLERCAVRAERQVEIALPEVPIPTVVIAPYHDNRQAPAKASQRGGHMEAAPRDDPRVRDPEVEQIAVDEQAVAEGRHCIEKLEQPLLDTRRCYSEVGIGHDHESAAKHGAKDG